MENLGYLRDLAVEVDKILKEELEKNGVGHDLAEARVYNVRNVGVQGDERTYEYPAEITLMCDGKFVWEPNFLADLSNRITNEVRGVNRVVYVLGKKK